MPVLSKQCYKFVYNENFTHDKYDDTFIYYYPSTVYKDNAIVDVYSPFTPSEVGALLKSFILTRYQRKVTLAHGKKLIFSLVLVCETVVPIHFICYGNNTPLRLTSLDLEIIQNSFI